MALYFFYAFIRIRKRKKEQRQQRHAGMLDALLEMLKNKPH
ncbi:hypothetical protein FLA_4183 [Filimonas lacunae]|nr:hypothetical protein FLA_4183 [Filimonas lacunae]